MNRNNTKQALNERLYHLRVKLIEDSYSYAATREELLELELEIARIEYELRTMA